MELLNSLSPWPRARPASGSRLGPRNTSATIKMMIRCVGWRIPLSMVVSFLGAVDRPRPGSRGRSIAVVGAWRLGEVALGRVSVSGQLPDGPEELRGLALEQAVGGEARDRGEGASVLVERGPHDRAGGQILVQELARFGQNQVGLVELSALGVQV